MLTFGGVASMSSLIAGTCYHAGRLASAALAAHGAPAMQAQPMVCATPRCGLSTSSAAQQAVPHPALQQPSTSDFGHSLDVQAERHLVPEVIGQIHSTESFSAVDGPGVRMVVFLQGCAMRCLFCSNPDTWSSHSGERTSSRDIGAALRRLRPYLLPGGGGVTVSGGEPLLQPQFTSAIFQEALELGLTTCLDTTGQGTQRHNWDPVLPFTDMALFCIKHLDPLKYTQLTGLKQAGALRFADQLATRGVPYWCRYVLLPGLSDGDEDIAKLAAWARQQPTLRGIELLPYHLLGKNKWEAMGLKYPLEGLSTPPLEKVLRVVAELEDAGLTVLCDAKQHATGPPTAHA